MAEGEWARTTVTVWRGSAEMQVRDLVGGTLEEQLQAAESWLGELADARPGGLLDDLEARLFCSWAPREGQHAMTLPSGLIRALARVNGTYWMDVYAPDD
ncbi:MAG: hypothetical protein J0I40_08350 [Cellulomonas sp.]|uniref:hypothetical protein n=1 Tax=Cellulomonas sp. 73-92 TaxID=1895740 RepID=UPI000926E8DD|nr:hypothetical protein [Cellulomonas sp. 73-92]MBN9375382.1 hypothetical protein [Cellulomonas sp.]OJV78899.1 MAG: hypothetical protein BGO37_00630 [Cellulomonas sp. 73-92]